MNDAISVTHPLEPGSPAEKKPRERIELKPATVVDFDPWADAVNPATLTQAGRDALPSYDRSPFAWFQLPPETRARLGGLAILLLSEHPPVPGERDPGRYARRDEVRRLFGVALRGGYRPRDEFEQDGLDPNTVAQAARFYREDPNERATWQRHDQTLVGLGNTVHISLLKELVIALDDSRGVVAALRETRKSLDAVLARLERRIAGSGR